MKRKLIATVAVFLLALAVGPVAARADLGIETFRGSLGNPLGGPLLQAGAHPDVTTDIQLKEDTDPSTGNPIIAGNPRDVEVTLPPGLVGNPTATPKCTDGGLIGIGFFASCPPESQVGIAQVSVVFASGQPPIVAPFPVYNLNTSPGVSGRFGFNVTGVLVFVNATVTNDGGYRIEANAEKISQALSIAGTRLKLWGVPAAASHDSERYPEGSFEQGGKPLPSRAPKLPLMSNPTYCPGAPLRTDVRVDSWQNPGEYHYGFFESDEEGNPMVIEGCDQVPFEASFEAQPTSHEAEAPTGLGIDITVPQNQFPEGFSASTLRRAVVTLPEGMTVSPASAAGLGSCTPAQIELDGNAPATCPESSKIGTVTIETPLLEKPLQGNVYVAQQGQNKFSSLLALYFAIDDPQTGTVLKLAGKVEPDPSTGRLVATFDDQPQLPFEHLRVNLFGGPRASLMTPPSCGTYSTAAQLVPWSGGTPINERSTFTVSTGPNGAPCPNGGFDPRLEAGTAVPQAGEYSPFTLRLSRADGTQRLGSLEVSLPKGLLAALKGVPYCTDPALAAIPGGEGTGVAQQANPSCPAASLVGRVAVGAGAGPSPLTVNTGWVYLAGPYKGAPLSLAIVTPALAGPFDLGNVVVRTALHVSPESTQVTAVSDPLPTILHGIPLDLRQVQVELDRPSFTLNPTSCDEQRVESTVSSVAGATAHPGQRFKAVGCQGLGFAPKLALRLSGAPPRRGGNPALRATVTPASGNANIGKASVILPGTELLEQGHIRTVCTRVQFAAGQCPAASIYGHAKAWTPLLDQPLEGPVYLRSNGGERKLPDLVADLNGQIHVVLVGYIDSVKRHGSPRIRTRFLSVPDAPVSRFVLEMQRGKKSLLANTTNLCKAKPRAEAALAGQNGKRSEARPLVKVSGCGGKAHKKSKGHKSGK
jgi:hypothetical protein